VTLVEVRCRGCKRRMGFAPIDYRIYCDLQCAHDHPASSSEDRDGLIRLLAGLRRLSIREIAERFGITRQRVDQIVSKKVST
jgi:hypothetical protein